jgi:glycosyltransferase involved in cell wall biosynthesis
VNVPAFSVVVIARNEAHKLPALCASLQEFLSAGGEMVVVDTGSDDATVRVAREAGARVEEVGARFHSVLTEAQAAQITAKFLRDGDAPLVEPGQMIFDFGAARNFAGTLAANEFIWSIDASDVVLTADLDFLDAQIRRGDVAAFDYLLRLGVARFNVVRFFDRRAYAWHGRVHEAPFPRGTVTGRRVVCTESQLLLEHLRGEKTRNYLAGLALDAIEHPAAPRWKHYVGRELVYERRYRSALVPLRAHVRSKDAWSVERAASHCLIGYCFEVLGRADAAAESLFRAIRVDPSRREPLLQLAWLCQRQGDFQGSVTFAAAALTIPGTARIVDAESHYTSDPHSILYWGLFWLGRRDEAQTHWETCLRMAPENETFREHARLFEK